MVLADRWGQQLPHVAGGGSVRRMAQGGLGSRIWILALTIEMSAPDWCLESCWVLADKWGQQVPHAAGVGLVSPCGPEVPWNVQIRYVS